MPPWGRPPGGRDGVGRFMEEAEDVYRFQELDSEDEKNGVNLDPGFQKASSGNHFNPDELYFNDMDLRAWESRQAAAAALDGVYDDDYDYFPEDEGYYEDAYGDVTMSAGQYEELMFQRVLDRIRVARANGEQDVQLTPEELQVYQNKLLGRRAPAVRPAPRPRPVSAPIMYIPEQAVVSTSSNVGGSGSGSSRSKKSNRTSLFSRSRKDKEKSSRKRSTSNVSDSTNQSMPAPGFVVPGPGGQPVYAPINSYPPRIARASPVRSSGSPSRPGSRSASLNSRHIPQATPPRDLPGAFPAGSPHRFRDGTPPPRYGRTPSESPHRSRSRSSSIQTTRLVPFPVTDYQHYTAEPYQYHVPGQPGQTAQPQYVRRVVSGPTDAAHASMPRRVPVPAQRATAPVPSVPSVPASQSDPVLAQSSAPAKAEGSDEDDGRGGVVVDAVPQAQASKSGSSSGSKDSDKKRKSSRSKRK